jgi:SAM-dependent methyltransferase
VKKKRSRLTARNADRHLLYQASVQAPDEDVALVTRLFRRHAGRAPTRVREDFCGTALFASRWVAKSEANVATGLDLDRAVLAWADAKNRAPLGAAASRLTLLAQDVTVPTRERFEVILACNYSYSVFKTRAALRGYFEAVRQSLTPDGIFIVDAWGGWDAQQPMSDRRVVSAELDGITRRFGYTWDRKSYDPISGHLVAQIHFDFPDRTKLPRAFTYDWRLWQLPELRELLVEAGFADAEILWEGEDEDGESTGEFHRVKRAKNDPIWNAYLVSGLRAK